MPVSFVMHWVSTSSRVARGEMLTPQRLRGLFLAALREVAPDAAALVHEGSEGKPYTLGVLERPGPQARIQAFPLRVTLLDDRLLRLPFQLQSATQALSLPLDQGQYAIQRIHMGDGAYPEWTKACSWETLLADAWPSRRYHFALHSPTCFRQIRRDEGIRIEMPLPLPGLLFGSIKRRVERWSGLQVPSVIPAIAESHLELTCPMSLEAYEFALKERQTTRHIIGTVGEVTYRCSKDPGDELRRWLSLLADASLFTGVGQRTTVGMGQIRRITGSAA